MITVGNERRFLALLRGINVGGKNVISKEELRQCFEDLGFSSVRTYIQSGNILFRARRKNVKGLTRTIEAELSKRSYGAQAVVISASQYASAVGAAPADWGNNDAQKHNALFMLDGIKPEDVLARLPPPRPDFETVTTGPGVIFWSASKKSLGRTTMMKLAGLPIYKQLTVRNHNTVFKLLELFEDL